MSAEPVLIDLNSDAGFGDQENDVNFDEGLVEETLLELVNGQSLVQGQVAGEFRARQGDNHLVIGGLGEGREIKNVVKGSDFEKLLGSMGRQFNDEVGGLSLGGSMANDGALGISGSGEGVCLKQRERAAEIQVSCFVRDGIDINVFPDDNVSVHVNEDKVSGFSDGDHKVIDSLDEANISQTIGGDVSGKMAALNLANWSGPIDLVVDLNKCLSTDGDASLDINAESDASKSGFHVSDLVWGKVRSHPWWPAQIFEPGAASAKAKRYFRKNTHLVAYFGDQTFAWNDLSRIKPFRAYFSVMEKQSSSEDFLYAVDCALEEVARRTEFGLACSCICQEVYAELKGQEIVNAGIRIKARKRDGGDSFSSATSFQPLHLIEFVKGLARSPQWDRVGTLQLVTSKSQLLAYYRWKGYYELPHFQVLGGWLGSAADISIPEELEQSEGVNEQCAEVDGQVASAASKPFSQEVASHKRKHKPDGDVSSSKKERSMSDLIAKHMNKRSKKGPNGEPGSKPRASASCAKRKSSGSCSARKIDPIEFVDASLRPDQGFRVGASILRVAGQMNGKTSILKHKVSCNSAVEIKSSSTGKSQGKEISLTDKGYPNEMLSELLWGAMEPMKCYSCLTFVSFFTEFRNFVSVDGKSSGTLGHAIEQVTEDEMVDTTMLTFDGKNPEKLVQAMKHESKDGMVESTTKLGSDGKSPEKHEQATKRGTKSVMENITKLEISRTPDIGKIEYAYWDEKIVKRIRKESLAAGGVLEMITENGDLNITGQSEVRSIPDQSTEQNNPLEKLAMEAEKPASLLQVDESGKEDPSPTALILNFSNLEPVPSEEKLNEIFSRYGPLKESETEVLNKSNRAKVVFKERADAEVAFSSAGKYRIFGPSLISYRLKYLPSKPSKAYLNSRRKNREKRKP